MKRLFLLCACCPGVLSAADLIRNGSFAAGLAGWDLYGSAARVLFTAVSVDGVTALRYAKTSAHPADNYHIDQTLTTRPDTMYRVSVRYRSAVLSPVVAIATTNWEQFKTAVLPPSTTWREQEFAFYSGTETAVKLQLFAGAQGRTREAFDGESVFTAIRCEAGVASVILDAAEGTHPIPPAFTGVNTLFWLETPEDLADGEIPARIAEARFGLLRYPAGTAAQNYDWQRNTVVNPQKYPGPAQAGASYLDTDGFIALARRVNAAPFLVLNLASIFHFTATPSDAAYQAMYESAAAWAAHFKRAGMRVACYELGNEHYLRDENSPYVMLTARQYGAIAQRMITAIRSVDSEAIFGAVGPREFSAIGALDSAQGNPDPWWPTVLSAIGDDLACAILHHYWTGSDYLARSIDYGAEVGTFRDALGAWQRANGRVRSLKIGYTEWGGQSYADAAAYALFVHEALASFAAHRTDFAVVWPHRRWSESAAWAQSQILDDRTPRAAHGVFAAWGDRLNGGTFIPFAPASAIPPYLFGAAARKGDVLNILLGNKSDMERLVPLTVRGTYTQAVYGVVGEPSTVVAEFRGDLTVPIPARSLATIQLAAPNAEPRLTQQPRPQTVTAGQPATFSVAVISSLPVAYQWQRDGRDLPGATAPQLTIPIVQPDHAGHYSVAVRTSAGSATSSAAALDVIPFTRGRIINLSVLTSVTAASPLLTVGTVVGGAGTSGPKPLLIRAAGPSLAPLGVGGALADPKLEVFCGQTLFAANDNWGGTAELLAAFASVGAFAYTAPTSPDAAVYHPAFPPGSCTVQVSGIDRSGGTVIAELYDSTPPARFALQTPRLINTSVLKQIDATETLTAGFTLGGTTQRQVLIRAIGPTLARAPFNVEGAMTDPQLTLFHGPNVVGANDNWGGTISLATASASVGAFALTSAASKDSVLLASLGPGSYAVQVNGVGDASGLTLVEIYEIP